MNHLSFQAAFPNRQPSSLKFMGHPQPLTRNITAQQQSPQDSFSHSNHPDKPFTARHPNAVQPFRLTFQARPHNGFDLPLEKRAQINVPYTQHVIMHGPRNSLKTTFIRFQPSGPDGADSKAAVGAVAANLLEQDIHTHFSNNDSKPLIITPTGNTPIPFYQALKQKSSIPWHNLVLGHLDEYIQKPELGLPDEATYRHYMHQHLWDDKQLRQTETWAVADQPEFVAAQNALTQGGTSYNPATFDAAIKAYEQKIRSHGKPLTVVLGIGPNGHIAFIEPPTKHEMQNKTADQWFSENRPAHWTKLKEKTLKANFGDPQQRQASGYTDEAVTLGLDAILSAKHIIILATGANKEDVIRSAFGNFNRPPTPYVPASYLKDHPDVTVITDF